MKRTHERDLENINFLQQVLIFDAENHQLSAANTDWLLMRGSMFRDILNGINLALGSQGNITVEKVGRYAGQRFCHSIIEKNIDKKEVPTILDMLINQGGWGKAKVEVDYQKRTAVIAIENCVIARYAQEEGNCVFLRGYFEGLFEGIFETKVECIERTCLCRGDNACTFYVWAEQKQ